MSSAPDDLAVMTSVFDILNALAPAPVARYFLEELLACCDVHPLPAQFNRCLRILWQSCVWVDCRYVYLGGACWDEHWYGSENPALVDLSRVFCQLGV